MFTEVKIQESIIIKWTAHQQSKYTLPQINRGLNKIL